MSGHYFIGQPDVSFCISEQNVTLSRASRQGVAPYADINEPALGEQLLEGLDRVVAAPKHGHGHRGCKGGRRLSQQSSASVVITVGIYLSHGLDNNIL